MANDTHLPHSLRIVTFFLRLTVGVALFYVGWSVLFNSDLAGELRAHSFPGLYSWLLGFGSPFAGIPATALTWILLITGVLIAIGLFTRLASLVALALVLANVLPAISISNFSIMQIVNDEVVLLLVLLVIIFSRAGQYFGLDSFVHVSRRKEK